MAKKNKDDPDAVDSDVDDLNFENFKGIHFGDKTEKYQDPETGCHFKYRDLCQRMIKMKAHRKMIDKRLGLPSSSEVKSPVNEPVVAAKPIFKEIKADKPAGPKIIIKDDPIRTTIEPVDI